MAESKINSDLENSGKTDNIEGTEKTAQTEVKTNDSDEVFEMFCETCMRDGIGETAYAFCPLCVTYFCSTCLKHHGKFFRKHTYIVGDEMYSDICSEKCETHTKEMIKFYCEICQKFACTICKEDLHTDTCSLKYLPDFLKNEKIEKELELLRSQHNAFTKKSSSYQKALSTKHDHLSNISAETQRVIKREKDNSFAKFDKEAIHFEDKIQTIKKNDCMFLDSLKETTESLANEMDRLSVNIKSLTTTHGKGKHRMFIDLKQLMGKVQEAETSFVSLEVVKPEPNIENQAKHISKEIEEFGTLIRSIQPKGLNEDNIKPRKIARTLVDIYVKADEDLEDCSISDCCLLSKRYLVACDKTNRSLKLTDLKLNKLLHVRPVNMTPETVTMIDDHQIAFVHGHDGRRSKIQFLSLTNTPTLKFQKRCILTEMFCSSVAYIKEDKLIISMTSNNEGKVQILDMDGTVLEDIDENNDGNAIFKVPYSLTVDYGAKYAYVSDWYKDQVIEVNLDTFDTRSVAYMWHPDSLVTDDEGFVYAIEYGTGKLLYFHPHHENSKKIELLKDKPTRTKPFGICYCSVEKKLYFGQTESDIIRVLKITDGV